MGTENTPSYYAIIPANVRYDKTIPHGARLLYGEITALCNKDGYCWATNAYFANLYEISSDSVSRWIKSLKDAGHIRTDIICGDRKEVIERRIYIMEAAKMPIPTGKNADTSPQKCQTPTGKNAEDNTTDINTTCNSNIGDTPDKPAAPPQPKKKKERTVFKKPTVEEVVAYCLERKNTVNAQTWFDYYEANGWKVGRNAMKDWQASIRYWEKNSFGGKQYGTQKPRIAADAQTTGGDW